MTGAAARREIQAGKLVRDNMPDIIRSHGDEPVIRIAGEGELRGLLCAKLVEEALEVATAEDVLDELADVMEVVRALAGANGLTADDVERARLAKRAERGGFTKRFVWYDDGSERSAPGWTP